MPVPETAVSGQTFLEGPLGHEDPGPPAAMVAPESEATLPGGALAVVKASWEAWERRDMPAVFVLYDPEVVWDTTGSGVPGLGVFHGHDGVRDFFHQWALDAFDDYYAVPEEFIEAGDRIVVGVRQGGTGKGSGAHVEMPRFWQAYTVRGAKIVRVTIHRDRDEALAGRPAAPD